MSKGNRIGKKIALLMISTLVLLIVLSPISADELDDTVLTNQDNTINEDIIEISTDNPILTNADIENNENALNAKSDNAQDECNTHQERTSDNTLREKDSSNALSSQYTLSDDTYSQYFSSNGKINENAIKSGDTLLIGQLTNKSIKITIPLNLIGSDDNLISNGQITIEKGGSNTNITGIKIVNTDANKYGIYLKYTENVSIKNCYLKTKHFAIPVIYSNYTQIINNTIDNDLSTGHTAIPLGKSHNNNISYNNIKNGANCIYLCQYNFADFNEFDADCNNNTISFNKIYGNTTVFCYGISVYGNNNTIINNSVEHTGTAIVTYQEGNKIYFNNCTGNNNGLQISEDDLTLNNTVDGEFLKGNQYNANIDSSEQEIIYVDGSNGNDSNDGTEGKPFKTIKAAVNYANSKEAGLFTIIVQEGTYNENNIQVKVHLNLIGNGTVSINGDRKNNIIIAEENTLLNISSINFINGRAKEKDHGAAIYSSGKLILENCNFTSNKAVAGAGAIYLKNGEISNCHFTNNFAQSSVIAVTKGLDIHNSTFTDNKVAQDGIITPALAYDIYNVLRNYAEINISECNFDKNKGPNILIVGKSDVNNCSFTNNNGSAIGGEMANVKDCIFENNTSTGEGAAINLATGNINDCIFLNNSAYNGGAISGGTFTVSNSTFNDNHAIESGGAIYVSNLNVTDTEFVNNTAKSLGGATYSGNNCFVYNSSFINNSAEIGGGICAFNANIRKTLFDGNNATTGKDIFIFNTFKTYSPGTNYVTGLNKGRLNLSDDNYFGNISSKDAFYEDERISKGIYYYITTVEDNVVTRSVNVNKPTVVVPETWLTIDDLNSGGIGDGDGNGIGNGTDNGIGNNTESNNQSDTEPANDENNAKNETRNNTAFPSQNGGETITGTGSGNGLKDFLNELINSITGTASNEVLGTGNKPKTDIKTDAGTYSTNPSKSDSSQSPSSPGDSGGKLKSYDLEKKVKIDIKDNIYLYLILLIIFASLLFFGFYRRKRDDEEEK